MASCCTATVDTSTSLSLSTPSYYDQADAYRSVVLTLSDKDCRVLAIYIEVSKLPEILAILSQAQAQYGDNPEARHG